MSQSEFLQRQLEFLQAGGLDREQALTRLRAEVADTELTGVARPDALLRHVEALASGHGGDLRALQLAVDEWRRGVEAAMLPVWRSYQVLATHFALVTAFAWVLVGMIAIHVLPQFAAIHNTLGGELPAATRLALAPLPRTLMLLALAACAIALYWYPRQAQLALLARHPGAGAGAIEALLGNSATSTWMLLETHLALAELRAGRGAEAALEFAARCVDTWPAAGSASSRRPLRDQRRLSAKLGTLEAELGHQVHSLLASLPIRAGTRRELLGFAVNLLLGIVIGVLIVGMYVPIFKLAVVV